jgi:general nucleoside transport system permease protein
MNLGREAYTIAVALLVAAAAGSALILVFGQSPARVYALLLARTWGDAYGTGQVLFKATPLIFTGLAVALAFRAGLFNIGAEGQMTAGAFATAVVAVALPAGTPWPLALPLAIAAGAAAGGALGALPGWLKARYGAHEVINTIMLNFIAMSVVLWLGNELYFVSETTHTAPVIAGARVPGLGIHGSAGNLSVLLALGTAAAVWYFLARTRRGFEWRTVGHSPPAAENAGVRIGRTWIAAMAASGAIAGLVGANYVLGYKHYFEDGMGRGVGFMGIAVALLGRNHPVGVVAAALLFGTLSHGGLAVNALVPKELVDVLQAVIILAIVAASAEVRRRWSPAGE